uniref:Glycosyltransferase n=1 Tax=candidate division WWE3 bacterium TaxID=2053526 RepID=A0A832E0T5_UNCKA
MERQSLVSVIIPTYNAKKFLPESVASALGQTYKNIEVIVVDDGSTDGTEDLKILQDPRVRYIKIKHSDGPATPRNVGIQNARGELAAFLDADDVWLPKKLEEEVKFMQEGKFDLVHCDAEIVSENGEIVRKRFHKGAAVPSGEVFADLFRGNFIITSSVVLKRSCFDKSGWFDASRRLRAVEDYDLWLRMSRQFKFGYLNKRLLKYREYVGSLSDEGVLRSHERLLAVWRKSYPVAKKVLSGKAKYQLYDLFKFLARTSKGIDPARYLKYKLSCLFFFPPLQLRKMGISLMEEIKGLIKL